MTEIFSPEKFHSDKSSLFFLKNNKQSILRQAKIGCRAISVAHLFSDLSTDKLQSKSSTGLSWQEGLVYCVVVSQFSDPALPVEPSQWEEFGALASTCYKQQPTYWLSFRLTYSPTFNFEHV